MKIPSIILIICIFWIRSSQLQQTRSAHTAFIKSSSPISKSPKENEKTKEIKMKPTKHNNATIEEQGATTK